MEIEIFEDNLTKEDCKDVPSRTAVRGIIKKDDLYLTVHLSKYDITTFPGGGIESNETLIDCVKREVLEETGVECEPIEETIRIKEYFHDSLWTNIYFVCAFVKQTDQQALTSEEVDLQLNVKWQSLETLMNTFENNMTKHEHGPAIHNREFLGLIHSIKGD